MESVWRRFLSKHLLLFCATACASPLIRENRFDGVELCNDVLPGSRSFDDVSKLSCAMKCNADAGCTAFTFTVTNSTCHLHYQNDLSAYLCPASSATSCHFQKVSEAFVCQNGGSLVSNGATCRCKNGYVGSQCEQLIEDCVDGISSGYFGDGLYYIYPSKASAPIQVFCDKHVKHIILLRFYGDPSFNRGMGDYKVGFGDNTSDYWVGLENLHLLTSSKSYVLGVQVSNMTSFHQRFYTNFVVKSEAEGYAMSFASQFDPPPELSSPMGDCLSPLQNLPFSTYDADNDGNATYNCAEEYAGGWWYNKQCSDCNVVGQVRHEYLTRPSEVLDGIFWNPGIDPTFLPSHIYMFLFRL